MIRYLSRRLLRSVLLLFGVSVLAFALFEIAPGDFFSDARLYPHVSEEAIAAVRSQHALDRPFLYKYRYWLGSVRRGEWGFSLAYNRPVGPLLGERARNTLTLTVTATAVAWLIAVPLGIWAAAGSGLVRRLVTRGGVSLALSVPDLLVILVLLLVAVRTGLLPVGGMASLEHSQFTSWEQFVDYARHLALPVTALVLAAAPALILHTLAAMNDVLDSGHIRTARANGIRRRRLLYRYALPAAANPLISLFGLSIGTLLSSSLLVESVLGWPGLGRMLLEATLQRDPYVVVGIVMLCAVFLAIGNLIADVLLYATDPRIRRE